ncbi:hypothetical protein B5M47_01520 [candidate division CPR3 bacterium 4484_211]|uniref:Uncharacterized protein n=1 Tax=candidate division CPR3 bacterium 4484_211 TaxID=1968527 RepID=A0A1W9NYI4_UNCC3|nr:MAG: hypothetical protein B5M47_01520 [candidate division CPR3 bacterium 4484_211]
MSQFKKIITLLGTLSYLLAATHKQAALTVRAEQPASSNKITIYFFYSKTCPHCAKEETFLSSVLQKYPTVNLRKFEVGSNPQNAQLLFKVSQKMGVNKQGAVPFTVIGDQYTLGYYDDQTTGARIDQLIQIALTKGCHDLVGSIISPQITPAHPDGSCQEQNHSLASGLDKINLPLVGEIKIKDLSLPALTITLGLLDGFNPCAMWALVFLIILLLDIPSRSRRWLLGSVFIFISGLVYFLFMTAWLNFFLFVGFIKLIRIAIGIAALGISGYNFFDYWKNKKAVCKVGNPEKKKQTLERLKKIVKEQSIVLSLIGISFLAFVVNLVELICSVGLPAVYTQVLSLNHLPAWEYYLYLIIYIFFFMIDDLFVFFAAMITLHVMGIETKYARYSRLIGGAVILIIGLLLLFKPEWLMFA